MTNDLCSFQLNLIPDGKSQESGNCSITIVEVEKTTEKVAFNRERFEFEIMENVSPRIVGQV